MSKNSTNYEIYKNAVQNVYRRFREDHDRKTAICLEFLEYLYYMGEIEYLVDMEDMTAFERGYVQKLIERQ